MAAGSHPDPVRRTAWGLAGAGLLPFLYGALHAMLPRPWFGPVPVTLLLSYGAVILSFVGGLYWMAALRVEGNRNLACWLLAFSVMPGLIGWGAALMEDADGLLLLIAGFLGTLGAEAALRDLTALPPWFWRLRLVITGLVCACLTLAWSAVREA